MPYRQRLVLIKNGYTAADSQDLVGATKYNIFEEKGSLVT